jgi:hypothetical protein
MKLNVRALAISCGLLWGVLAMFLTGLANLLWPGYGQEFLRAMASVYPGYHATRSFGQVVVGGLYGLMDGAVAGAIFAWVYNLFVPSHEPPSSQ